MAPEARHGDTPAQRGPPAEQRPGAADRASMRLGPAVVPQVVQQVVQRLIGGLEERITTAEWPDDRARLLEALYVLAQARNAAQARIAYLVGKAREAGASWAEVGKALGLTRQAAHSRYRRRRRRS